jgi:hypothetical protein
MMKSFAILPATLLGLFLSAASTQVQAQSYLTAEESKQVVVEIDSICGDTWCSGDLNYLFERLECGPTACYFDVRAEIRDESDLGGVANRNSRPYRCQLEGFQSRSDLIDTRARSLTYSRKLYEAIGRCLNEQLAAAFPVIYLPEVKSCRTSIEQKTSFQSAAHSAYAEVFYEQQDSIRAAAQTVSDMVQAYAKTDSSCQFSYAMAFRDQAECTIIKSKQVCSLPASEGQFLVLKDYVDGAAVLYFKKQRNPSPALGKAGQRPTKVKLADSSMCYTELLNLGDSQQAAKPFASLDHRSYFVSTKNLKSSEDARINAVRLVNSVIRGLNRSSPQTCSYQEQTVSLDAKACEKIGGRDVCLIAGQSSTSGYFIVSKDDAAGAFVSFIRFD